MNTTVETNSSTGGRFPGSGRAPRSAKAARFLQLAGLLLLPSIVCAWVPGTGAARAPETSAPKTGPTADRLLTDVKAARESDKLVVSILSDGPVSHQDFMLSNPPRLVIDFPNVENRVPFATLPVSDSQVKQVRVRQFQATEPKITRLVFDLADRHSKYDIQTDGVSVRVIFHDPAQVPAAVKAAGGPHPPAPPVAAAQKGELAASRAPERATAGTRAPEARQKPASPVQTPPGAASAVPAPRVPAPVELRAQAPSIMSPGTQFTGHPLTLDLVDVALVDFFRLMAEEGGVNVVMDPEIKGTISIKVVKVPWDQIFDAALANNGLDKNVEGNLVRIARKSTIQEEAKQREQLKRATLLAADVETRLKKLNYAKAASFVNSLAEQKTARGAVVVDERSNSLILTDIPSAVERMIQLVDALDVPQQQVEIEARIVSATRDFARDIGVQFGFVQGNLERVTVGGPNTFGTIGGTRPSQTPNSAFAAGNPVTGRGASNNTSSQSGAVSTGSNQTGNYNVNLPSQKAFGGLGLSVGNIFDTFLLDAAITAGETKGLAKLISQPKVIAQNNQPATVRQGLRFPVQVVANNTVTVQFQNASLTLTVTPQITAEGNIVLDLNVENNTADFGKQVTGIPSIRTSEANTRVLVSDGGTTVIGGILIEDETTQDDRVPGLASLPVVGNLFKRSSIKRSVQEVLFFVTPRVMK